MLEIGPNLLLAVLFVCVVSAICRTAQMVEDTIRSNRYRDEYIANCKIDEQKEVTKQVAIAHQHVPRDCSCITAKMVTAT